MNRLLVICFLSFFALTGKAAEEGDFKAGLFAGHVGITGIGGNALGWGPEFNYVMSSEFVFEISYLMSSHTDLKHSDLGLGIKYYLGSYDVAYGHVDAGVNFITHEISNYGTSTITSNGFGFYIGGGFDFEINRKFTMGLSARHHQVFETSARTSTGVDIKPITSYQTVLVDLLFTFGAAK